MLRDLPWSRLVMLAGIGQLAVIVVSLAIPRILRWREQMTTWRPLIRQMFWTYAGYIWTTNLCFGLVSTIGPHWLLDGSPLAAAVTGFIALYWGARLIIQFAYFDRSELPAGPGHRLAEFAMVALFAYLTLTYCGAMLLNLGAFTA
jgi:hypothetical protein